MSRPPAASTLENWLAARLAEVPAELAVAVRELVREAAASDASALVSAALRGFDRVAGEAVSRSSALELLAADALLTYAFEAAADPALGGGAAQAVRLAHRVGPGGRIGAHLADPGGTA